MTSPDEHKPDGSDEPRPDGPDEDLPTASADTAKPSDHSEVTSADMHAPLRGPRTVVLLVTIAIATFTLILGLVFGPWVHGLIAQFRSQQEQAAADGTWYISQMHPWIIQPEPGQCPICGMDLTPVDPERFAGEIAIDPVIVQNMGVRIAKADRGPLVREIRTAGTVEWDQTLVSDVNLRFAGWVEETHVDAMWERVSKGDPLLTIYSPALYAAAEEYSLARKAAGVQADEDSLVRAAQRRLELAGVPATEIKRLQDGGEARSTITITAPASGVVIGKNVNAGSQVAPQTLAYRIADPARVWVEAIVYEQQLPFISESQPARIVDASGRDLGLDGSIDTIYPVVDPRTREVRVRLVFDNPDLKLKPGMYLTVLIEQRLPGEHVRIPQMAVVGTGERDVVFISRGRGKFEPRSVELGPRDGKGLVAVTSGVGVGEAVVISGQFLLDSESKMRESLAKIMQGDLASDQAPAAAPSAGGSMTALTGATAAAWSTLLDRYLAVQDQLYRNKAQAESVTALTTAVGDFLQAGKAVDEHFHHRHPLVERLVTEAKNLKLGDELKPAFGAFSITLDQLVKTFGQPAGREIPLVGMRCGMADGIPDDGVWLQSGPDVRNPYFGAGHGMRGCAADSWGLPAAGDTQSEEIDESMPAPATSHDSSKSHHGHHGAAVESKVSQAPSGPPGRPVVDAYLSVAQAAYRGDLPTMQQAAKRMQQLADAGFVEALQSIVEAKDLQSARSALGQLGVDLREQLRSGSKGLGEDLLIHRCGMYRHAPDKGVWLQRGGDDPENPFFGHDAGMSACAVESWRVTSDGIVEGAP